MVIQGIEKAFTPTFVTLLEKCGRHSSTVKSLIAFRLTIDGKVLTPVGALSGDTTSTFGLGSILYKEISYGDVAMWLVSNNINLVDVDLQDEEYVDTNLKAMVRTIVLDGSKTGVLCIPEDNSFGITSTGLPYNIGAEFQSAELSLMFIERNRFDELPEEFSFFRLYRDCWLTLGNSTMPLCSVSWQEAVDSNKDDIQVEFTTKAEEVETIFKYDIVRVLSPFIEVL